MHGHSHFPEAQEAGSVQSYALKHHGGPKGWEVLVRCYEEPLRCPALMFCQLFLSFSSPCRYRSCISPDSYFFRYASTFFILSIHGWQYKDDPEGKSHEGINCQASSRVPMALHSVSRMMTTQ